MSFMQILWLVSVVFGVTRFFLPADVNPHVLGSFAALAHFYVCGLIMGFVFKRRWQLLAMAIALSAVEITTVLIRLNVL